MASAHKSRQRLAVLIGFRSVASECLSMNVVIGCLALHPLSYSFRLLFVSFKKVPSNTGNDKLAELLWSNGCHAKQSSRAHGKPDSVDDPIGKSVD
jgi:hypothetical protein